MNGWEFVIVFVYLCWGIAIKFGQKLCETSPALSSKGEGECLADEKIVNQTQW